MYGPGLFQCDGTLRDWSAIDRLHEITAPTLVLRGAHDEASEAAMRPFLQRIAGARMHVFPNSSHLPHIEEGAACLAVVRDFLERCDDMDVAK
jgi:L-proline amide hydrolase